MIKYDPKAELRKYAPKKSVEKLLSSRLTVKKAALSFVDKAEFIDRKDVSSTALKVVKSYEKRIDDVPHGEKEALKAEILADPKLLIQRVQNEVVTEISAKIKENYDGELYEWLPSDAAEPDPEHQLNYGKVFRIGEGEMPGDRIGCRCGMNILVKDTELDLS